MKAIAAGLLRSFSGRSKRAESTRKAQVTSGRRRAKLGLEILEDRQLPSTYFVATTGNDQNPGTLAQPFATIQVGINHATQPGDTVEVEGGTYKQELRLISSGNAAVGPIVLTNYNGQQVIVSASGLTAQDSAIDIFNASYVTVSGLEINNVQANQDAIGVKIEGKASNVILSNNVVQNIQGKGAYGILVDGTTNKSALLSNLTITGNTVDNIASINDPGLNGTYGIYLYDPTSAAANVTNVTISNNQVNTLSTANANMGDDLSGIRVEGAAANVTLSGNVIHDVNVPAADKISGNSPQGMGITIYGTTTTAITNLVITQNQVFNCKLGESEAVTLNGNVNGFQVTDNLVHDVSNIGIDCIGGEHWIDNGKGITRNGTVSGNTVYNAHALYGGGFAAGIYVDGGQNIVLTTNISHNNDEGLEVGAETPGVTASGITVSDNLIYDNTQAGLLFGGYQKSVGRVANSYFVNNTVYNNDTTHTGEGQLTITDASNCVVANNIFNAMGTEVIVASTPDITDTGIQLNYNLYYAPAGASDPSAFIFNNVHYKSFTAYQSGSHQDAHSSFAAPLFVNAPSGNFNLATGSPAIGTGTSQTHWFDPTNFNGNTRTCCRPILGRIDSPLFLVLCLPIANKLNASRSLSWRLAAMIRIRSLLVVVLFFAAGASAGEPIRLANHPALSPDGKTLAFDHLGDIWAVPTAGGTARPLTRHPAKDVTPKFSPDGKEIAFVSDRDGSSQVFIMPASGGSPRQVTFHTAGYVLHEWTPDGNQVLVSVMRDHAWSRRTPERFYLVDVRDRKAEQLLFDDYGASGTLSPDGKKLLFTREGPEWWRKGYTGSQASQIWLYDLESKRFDAVLMDQNDHRWPLWKSDGKSFYFCTNQKNGFVLNEMALTPRQGSGAVERKPIHSKLQAAFPDDSIAFPCVSRDGATMVFRHLFDLYRMTPNGKPEKIDIVRDDDRPVEKIERRSLDRASAVAFTNDGLEIAFIAGGDLWVMDTELREPKRITATAAEERSPLFAPDGNSIYFVSDVGGKTDIWKATRGDAKKPWWLNKSFPLEKVTSDGEAKTGLSFSPDGLKLAFIRGRGDLMIADANGKNERRAIKSWNPPDYDFSPDGKWLVYALYDNDFNRDIWLKQIDGNSKPFNLSRHPYNEDDPIWSPDGRMIAFVGAREEKSSVDIHFVYLRAEDDQKNSRDRGLEKALDKFRKGAAKKDGGDEEKKPAPAKKAPPEVVIDFEGIHDRIRRVTIPNSNESSPFWSPDSKKLAFTATIDGQHGTFTIEPPDNLKPALLSTQSGTHARWLKSGQIVWLSGGLPGSISGSGSAGGASTSTSTGPTPKGSGRSGGSAAAAPGSYRFTAYQDFDSAKKHQAAFDQCWRLMRDNWYDDKHGNRDWDAVRGTYQPLAATADPDTLHTCVWLMLGELNGSHLGFFAGSTTLPTRRPGGPPDEPTGGDRKWTVVTANLGVRFDESYRGPGLRIRDVLPDGPADQVKSRLRPGEIIKSIDGTNVDPAIDLTAVLNGLQARDIALTLTNDANKDREVSVRPISFTAARQLVYKKWLKDNQAQVERLSNGSLGYLHIRAMDMPSFRQFEEELYNAGAGKAGLVIDVRENGGGSTTDHLLTALTQPQHAIAVPRGGGQGYPQDRTVYATWDKPIVVLCNQNSFSNAEIFSHAIKTLKRGHLVGVPTAGGVISTGGTAIMDVGFLRLPTRGWHILGTGEDMELNGAVPDHIVWPAPGDAAQGKDEQIAKSVEVLLRDVKEWSNRPQSKRRATER